MPFVSEVFYFLIKKELMFFTNGCPCPSLATRVGRSYLQLKKLKIEKKIKTKKLEK